MQDAHLPTRGHQHAIAIKALQIEVVLHRPLAVADAVALAHRVAAAQAERQRALAEGLGVAASPPAALGPVRTRFERWSVHD